MKHATRAALLGLCSSAIAAVHAESKLEEVIVTSSRVEMPLRHVGTAVSVITAEDISVRGFNSLYDVLRTAPGVSANNTGGAGGITSVQIRGEDGYRTLVLIDDIDVSDTSGPQVSPRMEHLMSTGIQRVEILRGPQGLMYGADAGGVINIQTTAAEEGFHGNAHAELGRYDSQQVSGGLGGGNGVFDFSLMASDYETDGFNARDTDTALRDDDGYENTTLHGRIGWNVTEDLRLQVVARDVDTQGEYDGCNTADTFAPSDDCDNEFDQQAWRASADYDIGRFSHQLAYSGSDTDRQAYTGGAPTFGSQGDRDRWTYLGSFKGADWLRLVYGVDLLNESLDDGTFDRDRDQDGYYLEYQGEFYENLYVTAGARNDENDDYGSHTTWRSSAAYVIPLSAGEFKLRGTYGTGFRAPSLYEVAYNGGFFAYPPASQTNLKEEESEGFDLGVAWYGANGFYLEASYFDQEVDDVIYFDLQNFSGYLQDQGKSTSKGIELVTEWPVFDSLLLNGNYTYTDSEGVDGSSRPRRPEHMANLALQWSPGNGDITLATHLRLAHDAVETDGSPLDDYEVVDISASWRVLQGLELYGRVENLFDEDYQEVSTYNTSGAAGYAGIRYSF